MFTLLKMKSIRSDRRIGSGDLILCPAKTKGGKKIRRAICCLILEHKFRMSHGKLSEIEIR